MLKSPLRVLLQTPSDDPLQRYRQILRNLTGRLWVFTQYRSHGRHSGVALKCSSCSDHLVEHRTEAEDVGPYIHLLTFGLLRRHVRSRSPNGSFFCFRTRARGKGLPVIGLRAFGPVCQLDQTKVEHFRLAPLRNHNVARFQVTMNNARRMSSSQSIRNLGGNA